MANNTRLIRLASTDPILWCLSQNVSALEATFAVLLSWMMLPHALTPQSSDTGVNVDVRETASPLRPLDIPGKTDRIDAHIVLS